MTTTSETLHVIDQLLIRADSYRTSGGSGYYIDQARRLLRQLMEPPPRLSDRDLIAMVNDWESHDAERNHG